MTITVGFATPFLIYAIAAIPAGIMKKSSRRPIPIVDKMPAARIKTKKPTTTFIPLDSFTMKSCSMLN